MNVMLKIQPPSDAATIAHSIMAYGRASDELELELPIPLFLDTLALKIACIPPEDKYGALSYPLQPRAVQTFRFLLGLDVNLDLREYFLESTVSYVTSFSRKKLTALELLTELTPYPRYKRTDNPRISERELILPTLRLLSEDTRGWLATSDLISRLTRLFAPSGLDAEILEGRNDTYFSQKVRNMISHRDQPSSFINRGLAHYERGGLKISSLGRATVRAILS